METAYTMYLVAERGLSDNTVELYRAELDRVEKFLAARDKTLSTAAPEDLQAALAAMTDQGLSPSTVHGTLNALRAWLKYLAMNGQDTRRALDYLIAPKKSRQLPRVPSEHEINTVFAAIDRRSAFRNYLRDIALAEVLYSGLRASEVCALRVQDIVWTGPHIRVLGKGDKERMVNITLSAAGALQAYVVARNAGPGDLVFVRAKGTRKGRPMDRHAIKALVAKWARWAKVSKLHPHAFRHACATHWYSHMMEQDDQQRGDRNKWGGQALLAIRDQLGHDDIVTTQRYVALDTQGLKRTYRRYAPARMDDGSVPCTRRNVA